jgi:hypothetical protein
MTRIPAIAHLAAVALIATGSAFAQDHGVKATVPFNFTVNGSSLPAGSYTISSDSSSANVLSISNRQEKVNIWAMGLKDRNEPGKAGSLVFNKYGDRYFLNEIRFPHSTTKVHFPASKAEKRAKERSLEAGLNVDSGVLIALN